MDALTVGLIFGGPSHEHEVSLASAWNIRTVLSSLGCSLVEIGIDKGGKWFKGSGIIEGLLALASPELLPKSVSPLTSHIPLPAPCGIEEAVKGLSVAVPVIHGNFGEDGTLQAVLDAFGIRYIGCGQLASLVCYCKDVTKAVLRHHNLPALPSRVLTAPPEATESEEIFAALISNNRPSLFIKPASSGSSFGISTAQTAEELRVGTLKALQYSSRVLIEPAVEHTEYVFGVIETESGLFVSCGAECVPTRALYDYQDKYIVGNPLLRCPANIAAGLQQQLGELAKQAFVALQCKDLSRVDFFVERGTNAVIINEVNTIPGFTGSSVFSKVMSASGWPLEKVFETLIRRVAQSTAISPREWRPAAA